MFPNNTGGTPTPLTSRYLSFSWLNSQVFGLTSKIEEWLDDTLDLVYTFWVKETDILPPFFTGWNVIMIRVAYCLTYVWTEYLTYFPWGEYKFDDTPLTSTRWLWWIFLESKISPHLVEVGDDSVREIHSLGSRILGRTPPPIPLYFYCLNLYPHFYHEHFLSTHIPESNTTNNDKVHYPVTTT